MRKEFVKLQAFIDSEVGTRPSLRVLEAGCGSNSYIRFQQDIHLTGIDISARQLERNTKLDEKILGDIQDHEFQPSSFDIIICVDVLEHLPEPGKALGNFANSLRKDGLIVLKVPNLLSLKGLAAKFTPHWIHKQVYRKILFGAENKAEQQEPFKTFFRTSITPDNLKRKAHQLGLDTVFFDTYDFTSSPNLQRRKLPHALYKTARAILHCISFKRLGDSEYILVLKKSVESRPV